MECAGPRPGTAIGTNCATRCLAQAYNKFITNSICIEWNINKYN